MGKNTMITSKGARAMVYFIVGARIYADSRESSHFRIRKQRVRAEMYDPVSSLMSLEQKR